MVAERLAGAGWRILGTNVRVGRSELDIVAVDPGPPRELVVVEVRANRASGFGAPEERVDRAKLRSVYRGALGLRASSVLEDGTLVPRLALRVDLISIELRSTLGGTIAAGTFRHLRGVIA